MPRHVVPIVLLWGTALSGGGIASAAEPVGLHGAWVGERDGRAVHWTLESSGRLRAEGRPASYEVAGDTLKVYFDPPFDAPETDRGEKAVYRFVASLPPSGPDKLYLFGFDLDAHGLWLERHQETDLDSEEETDEGAEPRQARTPRGGRVARPAH